MQEIETDNKPNMNKYTLYSDRKAISHKLDPNSTNHFHCAQEVNCIMEPDRATKQ